MSRWPKAFSVSLWQHAAKLAYTKACSTSGWGYRKESQTRFELGLVCGSLSPTSPTELLLDRPREGSDNL